MQSPIKSILIIKLSAIGDVVHSLPFLEVLRENFPVSRIDWLVEEEASEVLNGHPAIDRIIVSQRKSWHKRLKKRKQWASVTQEIVRFLRDVRGMEYDLAIDLQGLLKSGLLTGLCKGKRKVGASGAREVGHFFLSEKPVPVDYEAHAIERYLKIAAYLGCDHTAWKGTIPVSKSDERNVKEMLLANGIRKKAVVAINPMARWESKLWEPRRFAVLADRLQEEATCQVVFTGSERDWQTIEEITHIMKTNPVNLAGRTTLKELACLYADCQGLVTTDTGPMHIAAAMGCRVVALFGPTAPWRTGPYGDGHRVIRIPVGCSPCFKRRCGFMACMKDIAVEEVFSAVQNIIE